MTQTFLAVVIAYLFVGVMVTLFYTHLISNVSVDDVKVLSDENNNVLSKDDITMYGNFKERLEEHPYTTWLFGVLTSPIIVIIMLIQSIVSGIMGLFGKGGK